jgi:transposase-like protein
MAASKLTDEQKQKAYRLYYDSKYTYSKIAQEMGVSVPTIVRAVSEQEKQHKADDLTQAPLACDQVTGDQSAAAAAPVPASVLAAVAERIKAVEAKIEAAAAGIALKQRELDAMIAELETLKKWKEGQEC